MFKKNTKNCQKQHFQKSKKKQNNIDYYGKII